MGGNMSITYDENYKGIEGVNYPENGTAFYQQDFMKEQADIGGEIIDRELDYFTPGVIEGFEVSLSATAGCIDISSGVARDAIGRRIIGTKILSKVVPDFQENILSVKHVWKFDQYVLDGTSDTKFQRRHSVAFNFSSEGNVPSGAIKLYKIQRSGSSVTIVGDLRVWAKIKVIETNITPSKATHLTSKGYVDGLDTQSVKLSNTQTISGVKTFSALPQSTVTPTTVDELTRKGYVDSLKAQLDAEIASLKTRMTTAEKLYAVGSTYVQYPSGTTGTDATDFPTSERPATKFGGTWSQVFNTEGVFFRTEGGQGGNLRTSGLQEDNIRKISGTFPIEKGNQVSNLNYITLPFYDNGNIAPTLQTHNSTLADSRNIGMDTSKLGTNFNGTDTRPRNRYLKIWRRTA
jgi:hypothetical protein